jgi:hypothetical protein
VSVHGEEVDAESDLAEWLDVMVDPGRDGLFVPLGEIDPQRRAAG